VVPGDTANGIAGRFGLCVIDIENANSDADPLGVGITAGQTLVVERTTGPHHGEDCHTGHG
jgi:hypothetical protein